MNVLPELDERLRRDVELVSHIDAVPSILDVVCRTTGMGFAAVARVTETRWICCSSLDKIGFGLGTGGELQVETTICNEIRGHGEPVVIDHVAEDALYCRHPTPARYGFQSYVSFPIWRRSGEFFGTLCAIDPKPAHLQKPEITGMFRLFGDLISFHLDAQERLQASEAALSEEQQTAVLREQFIAVLSHDLRTPLNALSISAQLLRSMPQADATPVLARMDRSIIRMSALISNVTDLARGRLGGGLSLSRSRDRERLEAELQQVIAELRAAWPDRDIRANVSLTKNVFVDIPRIGQLLSNLLGNALTHGAPDRPVLVDVKTEGGVLEVKVTNSGAPLSTTDRERLFQPFYRGAEGTDREGLGLGLYIVSEIAKAHGGSIDVASDPRETAFTFRAPIA